MSEQFDFEKIKREAKRAEFKEKVKDTASAVYNWAGDHKAEIAGVALFLLAGTKQVNKIVDNHRDDVIRKRRIYDPKEGHYWNLRRELRTDEYLELERLEKRGYSKGEALKMMGLLKKR